MQVIAASLSAEVEKYQNMISGTSGYIGSTPMVPMDGKV